jgi:hypothetical protein
MDAEVMEKMRGSANKWGRDEERKFEVWRESPAKKRMTYGIERVRCSHHKAFPYFESLHMG